MNSRFKILSEARNTNNLSFLESIFIRTREPKNLKQPKYYNLNYVNNEFYCYFIVAAFCKTLLFNSVSSKIFIVINYLNITVLFEKNFKSVKYNLILLNLYTDYYI